MAYSSSSAKFCGPSLLVLLVLVLFSLASAAHAGKRGQNGSAPALPAETAYPLPPFTQATVYLTARDTGERMKAEPPVGFLDWAQPNESITCIMLDPTRRFQTIVGFGGAITDASAETFYKLPADKQTEILDTCFSPDKGMGFTLSRTSINSCDFSSGMYSYDDTPGDTALKQFTIAHDLKYRIPLLKAALAASQNQLHIFASPWSPPAWMKTNNAMDGGGTIRPEDKQAWADYFVRYIKEYAKVGVPIWGLTVQNEPMASQDWESCVYTAQDEANFVRDYLGPTLHKNGLAGVKLMIWDHNRNIMYQRAQVVYEDPKAAQYVWGEAFHWYVGDHYDSVQIVHDAFPDKNLLYTEGGENLRGSAIDDNYDLAERYGRNMILDLNRWSTGWDAWNFLLDQTGGPNHVGNNCQAPVIADTTTGKVYYHSALYYIGHFSKFIRPGAQRIACTSDDDRLVATSFVNPDNSTATVVYNGSESDFDYYIWLANKTVELHIPGHAIETVVIK